MNKLILTSAAQTMTSREIADLFQSRHDNVKRAIKRLVKSSAINQPPMEDGGLSGNNMPEKVYVICKRDTYVIVAQMSPEFTARLVDRWQELEQRQKFQLPTTFQEALRLAADQAEKISTQAAQIEAAAPSVAFVEKYADATGLKGFRQVCKLLKAKEPEFRQFLIDEKIMYQLNGEYAPYANHIDAGRFEIKTGASDAGHAFNSAKFTPKGITWVAGEYAKYNLGESNAK